MTATLTRRELAGLGLAPAVVIGIQAGITAIGYAIAAIRKRGAQKLQASYFADEAERLLVQNLAAFEQMPTRENQRGALANFDLAWDELISLCGDPQLGDAGRRCISERARGGRWDWFALYRDPIAEWSAPSTPPASALSLIEESAPASTTPAFLSPGGGDWLPAAAGVLLVVGGVLYLGAQR